MSGYCACACRDCFEIAIANEGEENVTLCNECEDAGCEPNEGDCCVEGRYTNESKE
jgi:hypothetical protein